MNKPLFTGRQLIWIEALNLFEGNGWNWILGIGSKVKVWDIYFILVLSSTLL